MKTKVTKADRRRKAKANPVEPNGLTTSFTGWKSAGFESHRRAAIHNPIFRSVDNKFIKR